MRDASDSEDDDRDSYEAQARQMDQQDFRMNEILGGHEERLRGDAPYRIPTQYLQSGAATPSRGEDLDYDATIASRATSPAPYLQPAPQSAGSRAPTPAYIKAEVIDEDFSIGALAGQVIDIETFDSPPPRPRPQYSGPDYFGRDRDGNQILPWQPGQTPYWTLSTSQSTPMPPPSSIPPARQQTPLFLPDSRGPTPYAYASRDSTPQFLSNLNVRFLSSFVCYNMVLTRHVSTVCFLVLCRLRGNLCGSRGARYEAPTRGVRLRLRR